MNFSKKYSTLFWNFTKQNLYDKILYSKKVNTAPGKALLGDGSLFLKISVRFEVMYFILMA